MVNHTFFSLGGESYKGVCAKCMVFKTCEYNVITDKES
ncbi:hypothetical protein SDC9_96104 [bioreactor metagenome]|uniref:Uncharacterized protein n=1 Tax=bioreactor metagenome TaxID=1076179 RepID=A0A645A859_9ZZZZ